MPRDGNSRIRKIFSHLHYLTGRIASVVYSYSVAVSLQISCTYGVVLYLLRRWNFFRSHLYDIGGRPVPNVPVVQSLRSVQDVTNYWRLFQKGSRVGSNCSTPASVQGSSVQKFKVGLGR
jgi:hypothetical protein